MTLFGNTQAFTEEESSSLCWKLMEMNFLPMAAFEGELFLVGNQAFLDLIGYSKEDLEKGINWKEITPKEYLGKADACAEELTSKTISTPFEKEYFRKDGSRVRFLHQDCIVAPSTLKGIAVLKPIQ